MKKTFANTTKDQQPLKPRGILQTHKADEKARAPKKRGRPNKETDQLQSKLTLYFTEAEMEHIRQKADLVPMAKHLRHFLLESGYFKR